MRSVDVIIVGAGLSAAADAGRRRPPGARAPEPLQIGLHAAAERGAHCIIIPYQPLLVGVVGARLDDVQIARAQLVPDRRPGARRDAPAFDSCSRQPPSQRANEHAVADDEAPCPVQWREEVRKARFGNRGAGFERKGDV